MKTNAFVERVYALEAKYQSILNVPEDELNELREFQVRFSTSCQ